MNATIRKWVLPIGIICIALLILGTVMLRVNRENEYQAETADLLGMRDAELAANAAWNGKLPDKPVEYWYDANTFTLIPAEHPKPNPCGLGTRRSGNSVEKFEEKNENSYGYSMNEDYRDKVLHVVVSDVGGKLQVDVDWVEAM